MSVYAYIPYAVFLASEHKEMLLGALIAHPSTRGLAFRWIRHSMYEQTVGFGKKEWARYKLTKGKSPIPKVFTANPVATGITAAAVAAILYQSTHKQHKAVPGILMGGAGFSPGVDPGLVSDASSAGQAVQQYWGLPGIPVAQIIKHEMKRR